jgi:KDO2-lipid IV(A) lauroyltransferase
MFIIVYYLAGYRKKVVFENLHNAFPDKTDKEIKQIAFRFYRHFCDLIVETIKLPHLNDWQILKRVNYRNLEILDELYRKQKSITGIIGHYNNWEWQNSLSLVLKHKVIAIYKPLTNNAIDRLMLKLRIKYGAVMVPMSNIYKETAKYKQLQMPSISIFIADQSPPKSEIRYRTMFLNQDTPIYLGAEKIARKMDHAVIFLKMRKIKRGFYKIDPELLFENAHGVSENEITEAHVKALEKLIIEKPEYWLWTHRRWKHKNVQ